MTATTRLGESVRAPRLYVAFELGRQEWLVALTSGFGVAPWLCRVAAGDWRGVDQAVARGRDRLGLPGDAGVVSCYEAGRDGFWIHRALGARGIANRVVDSSSIEVNRRARRAKTDRLDARKLVAMLVRVCAGERGVWCEVHVPSEAVEAARHVSRERTALTQEATHLTNQMRGWLTTWGATLPRRAGAWWTTVRDWEGRPLPAVLQARLMRTAARLAVVDAQLAELEAQQAAAVAAAPVTSAARALVQLKGIATTSASVLLDEGLVWRAFQNRRQIGGLLGFAPTPHQSGDLARGGSISGAGNARLQAISIQLAWNWIRWQPTSALTQWYHARFGTGKRLRRIGIVAVARKLVIALWRYVTHGVLPTGAVLKAA